MMAIFRTIKFAFQDVVRNMSQSVTTVSILVLMLLSINVLIVVRFLTDEAAGAVKNQIDVSVFFVPEASDEQVAEVERYVTSFPEVTEVILYSRDEVFDTFRAEYSDNPEIIASLEELDDNPLGPTMIVKTRDPKSYENVITLLSVPEYEDIVVAKTFTDTETAIKRIDRITSQVERFSLALSVMFAVIAFLIIFNTVRIAIYAHRIEISIKKLVGATNWFVRGPYLISAVIYSIVSLTITYAIVMSSAGFLDLHIELLFDRPALLSGYLRTHVIYIYGVQLIALLIFTMFSSFIAMRRHLRV